MSIFRCKARLPLIGKRHDAHVPSTIHEQLEEEIGSFAGGIWAKVGGVSCISDVNSLMIRMAI